MQRREFIGFARRRGCVADCGASAVTLIPTRGGNGAMSMIAVGDPGRFTQLPDIYMRKMAVGPRARGSIDLLRPVGENIEAIAEAFGRRVKICVLRNAQSDICPEDCGYCSQSAHHKTAVDSEPLMARDTVMKAAQEAKSHGASRFCMGAAWREVKDGPAFDNVLSMVRGVRAASNRITVFAEATSNTPFGGGDRLWLTAVSVSPDADVTPATMTPVPPTSTPSLTVTATRVPPTATLTRAVTATATKSPTLAPTLYGEER